MDTSVATSSRDPAPAEYFQSLTLDAPAEHEHSRGRGLEEQPIAELFVILFSPDGITDIWHKPQHPLKQRLQPAPRELKCCIPSQREVLTREIAAKLVDQDGRVVDDWKANPTLTCDAERAFGGDPQSTSTYRASELRLRCGREPRIARHEIVYLPPLCCCHDTALSKLLNAALAKPSAVDVAECPTSGAIPGGRPERPGVEQSNDR